MYQRSYLTPLQRKTTSALYPQIGHVFANLPAQKPAMATQVREQSFQNNSSADANSQEIYTN